MSNRFMSAGTLTESRIGLIAGPEYGGPDTLGPSAERGVVLCTLPSLGANASCWHQFQVKKDTRKRTQLNKIQKSNGSDGDDEKMASNGGEKREMRKAVSVNSSIP